MKYVKIVLMALPILLFSCTTEAIEEGSDPDLVGKWKLVEVLADPGNGSGTFQAVDSDREVEFFSNGTFAAKGNLCAFSPSADEASEGTYDGVEKKIAVNSCPMTNFPITYEIQGNELILNYFCIEPCRHKYRK